jgi:hypothetical protein
VKKRRLPRPSPEAATNNIRVSNIDANADHKAQSVQSSEPIALTDVLACLTVILPRLAEAVETAQSMPRPDRLTLRGDELAEALGVSARELERAFHAGNMPRPDLYIGKLPLWRVESIRNWFDSRG